jgi:hypothetical protein
VGAVLSQGEIGKYLPIASDSRFLNKAERNYSATEKESDISDRTYKEHNLR